ncbi:MAG: 2-dehydropantoate 2-reductase [Xanthobacteraceae bacterium]
MKICIFGAGAIGGYLAAELTRAGADVCAIARGAHLNAIKAHGLTLHAAGETRHVPVTVSDDAAEFGPQDFVVCSLKAHQASDHAEALAPLLGPRTAVVTAVNGIPWWYFYKTKGAYEGRILRAVDPEGRQWNAIGPQRAIGCVVDCACELVAPGVIEHHEFNRLTLGEPDGSISDRVTTFARMLTTAGFDAPVREEIRWNIWLKLWSNLCFNPISMLTGATVDRIATEPALRALCERLMREAKCVSDALEIIIDESWIGRRLNNAAKVAGHKPSMLQDFERGRPMEIDALMTAVVEMARLAGTAIPTIELVLGLVQERAEQAGLYRRPQ